jgi:hypothetical protein
MVGRSIPDPIAWLSKSGKVTFGVLVHLAKIFPLRKYFCWCEATGCCLTPVANFEICKSDGRVLVLFCFEHGDFLIGWLLTFDAEIAHGGIQLFF